MSYDWFLFRPADGEDPLLAGRRYYEDESTRTEPNPGPINPEAQALKRQLVEALLAHDPRLTPFRRDYAALATMHGVDADEARRRFRDVELNTPVGGTGIQVPLFDDTDGVTVPYCHDGPDATTAFDDVTGYLQVLVDTGGFTVYDPQLDAVIDPALGLTVPRSTYGRLKTQLDDYLAAQASRPDDRPWWKKLF